MYVLHMCVEHTSAAKVHDWADALARLCCSASRRVAACCNLLQCVAVYGSVVPCVVMLQFAAVFVVCCIVL